MPNQVNWNFISELEGKSVLTGYVPKPDGGKIESGVTVATGFDIGQRNTDELRRMFDTELSAKLEPYCNCTGERAQILLERFPLKLTQEESDIIDSSIRESKMQKLERDFYRASMADYGQLPEAWQTVIASVSFQYGRLSIACPKFWKAATECDEDAMFKELWNFGDNFQTRRRKEARYLVGITDDAEFERYIKDLGL